MTEKCPKCGAENTTPEKTWTVKSPKSKQAFLVSLYLCRQCEKSFKKFLRIQP